MKNPLVSIIIPTYNRAHLILETLNSIVAQTYTNWECIIVDDGSTDSSLEVIESYCKKDTRFRVYKRPENRLKGANACRNYGVELSKGKYLLFLDSDDLLMNSCLFKRVSIFEVNRLNDFIVFDTIRSDNKKTVNKDPNVRNRINYLKMFLSHDLPWQTTSPIWKKKSFLNIEGFDENLLRFQDVELHTRTLLENKIKFIKVDIKDSIYRIDKASIKRYSDDSFIKDLLLENFLYFNKKTLSYMDKKTTLFFRKEFRMSFYKIIETYTYNTVNIYKLERGKLFDLCDKHFIFSSFDKFFINAICNPKFLRLSRVKGLGLYRAKKRIELVLKFK